MHLLELHVPGITPKFTLFPPLKEILDDFSLVLMLLSMNVYFATGTYKQHNYNFPTLQKLPGIANAI